MSDHLPEHLAELLEDIDDGFICAHPHKDALVSKLRTILAAALACACQDPPHNECADNGTWCLWCEAEGYGATCRPECPHRQLREALADD